MACQADIGPAPILRIEAGEHTGPLQVVARDADGSYIYTGGHDKTIRVWDSSDLRLEVVFRVPIDNQYLGQINGLAVDRSGSYLAVAGNLASDKSAESTVLVFDLTSNEIAEVISGFPAAIGALAYSPNRRFLLVGCLGVGNGLYAVEISTGRVLLVDNEYADGILSMQFREDGVLAVAALDGKVRIYDEDLRLSGRKTLGKELQLVTPRWSPNGDRLAVGMQNAPIVEVLSALDLSTLVTITAINEAQQNFAEVAWSTDGKSLYTAGAVKVGSTGSSPNPDNEIYRWQSETGELINKIAVSKDRITGLLTLPDDKLTYVTEEPSLGIVTMNLGRIVERVAPGIINSNVADTLRIGKNGESVSISGGGGRYEFNMDSVSLSGAAVTSKDIGSKNLDHIVTGLHTTLGFLSIDALDLELQMNEIPRSFDFTNDGEMIVVGGEWTLYAFEKSGKRLWANPISAVPWDVEASREAGIVVAALSDGTLRWYRLDDGEELMRLFVHAPTKEWIAWIPSGYYMSSPYGDRLIGWHLNNGVDKTPEFIRAVQLERLLYRPDIVKAWIRNRGLTPVDSFVSLENFGSSVFDVRNLRQVMPPAINGRATLTEMSGSIKMRLEISASKSQLDMLDTWVFVNDIPQLSGNKTELRGSEQQYFRWEIEMPVVAQENAIRVEVATAHSIGVWETTLKAGHLDPKKFHNDLYVLSIGTSNFKGLPNEWQLDYAAADAEAFARTMHGDAITKQFRNVHTLTISDNSKDTPTRKAINKGLEFLKDAKGSDTVMLFLASHGISDKAGNYYFVPADAAQSDIVDTLSGRQSRPDSLISWQTFFSTLRKTAGRRYLIVDTCQASRIGGTYNFGSLAKRSASSAFGLLAASAGGEESQEYAAAGHGLFTYSIIRSFSEANDLDGDGALSIREIFDFATLLVDRNRDPRLPQTPQIVGPPALTDHAFISIDGSTRQLGFTNYP